MEYRTLTPEALADLRLERLRALEIEHARHIIRLEDAADEPERAQITSALDDLERRHAVHVGYADVPDEPDSGKQHGEPEHAEGMDPVAEPEPVGAG